MADGAMSLSERFREARRRKGLTQSRLAREAGCTQSAISMFEAGRTDALAKDKLAALATILGIEAAALDHAATEPVRQPGGTTLKYCPVEDCPSNVPYVLGDLVYCQPRMVRTWAEQTTRCRHCGEILEDQCPNPDCGVPLTEGGFCAECGTAYVTVTQPRRQTPVRWADEQRERIRELRALTATVTVSPPTAGNDALSDS